MRWSWDLNPLGALRLLTPVIAAQGRRQETADLGRAQEPSGRRAAHPLTHEQPPTTSPPDTVGSDWRTLYRAGALSRRPLCRAGARPGRAGLRGAAAAHPWSPPARVHRRPPPRLPHRTGLLRGPGGAGPGRLHRPHGGALAGREELRRHRGAVRHRLRGHRARPRQQPAVPARRAGRPQRLLRHRRHRGAAGRTGTPRPSAHRRHQRGVLGRHPHRRRHPRAVPHDAPRARLPGFGRFVATLGIVTGAAGILCEALGR